MAGKGLLKRIAGVRLTIAIQVFSTLLVLALGYFAIERNLRYLTHYRQQVPVYEIKSTLQKIRAEVIVIAFVAFLAGLTLAHSITKQLKKFTRGLENIATGDIRADIQVKASDEFLPLDSAIKKLTDSLNRFIHHSITDAIILLDGKGTIQAFNPNAEYISGYKANEVIGSKISILFPDDERNRSLYNSLLSPDRNKGGWTEGIVSTMLTKNGGAMPVRVSSFSVMEDGSRAFGLVVGIFDIREFKKLREELQRTDRLSTLGMFVSGLAHEIKNPLGAIKGLVELINEDIPEDSPKKVYCVTILKEINRLDSVVRRLLEFANPKEGIYRPIDINSLIDDLVNLLKGDMEKKGVILEKRLHQGLPHVEGDRERVSMAIMNIMKNAIEATPEGGRIYVRTDLVKEELLISVENQGAEIEEEEVKKIFNPFYTTKEYGVGLGLAISHHIIRAHNGHIEVKGIDGGGGTAFEIYLPVEREEGVYTAG